jgi:probable rRNA maturation factor
MNAPKIDLLNQTEHTNCPSLSDFTQWVDATCQYLTMTLAKKLPKGELTFVIIDTATMTNLNQEFRHKSGPTNVLSFPDQPHPGLTEYGFGDVVFCFDVMQQEAQEQHKPLQEHFAHLTIHGVLHLLGYDHCDDASANAMETLEANILNTLHITNPYQ